MQTTFALAALAAVAYAAPQGVTTDIPAPGAAPAGCSPSYSGSFEITVYNATTVTKRDIQKRDNLVLTLANGQLTDAKGRTGYIASNYQFQFDAPPQTGAIYTGGFTVCQNGSLALGSSNVFYECNSGAINNLYNENWAPQCYPVLINAIGGGSVGQQGDGQPTAVSASGNPVTQITDGQPQGASAVPVPVTEYTDGQPQVVSVMPHPVTQISDGQVQANTAAPVTQISDGQVQAPTKTGAPVTQISDGQVQAPTGTGAPVTQISDGQVQAPTATVAPVTQISDGQIQAPSKTGAPVTQISDGQIQAGSTSAPKNATTSAPTPFTGAGNGLVASSFGALVMAAAAVLLL